MIINRQEQVTSAITAVMERTTDPRFRQIMVSLVRHLHGFVREVRLTEAEFQEAIAILNEMGKLTSAGCRCPVVFPRLQIRHGGWCGTSASASDQVVETFSRRSKRAPNAAANRSPKRRTVE
jgi:hypothetical protein